jgi:hypothetical protein
MITCLPTILARNRRWFLPNSRPLDRHGSCPADSARWYNLDTMAICDDERFKLRYGPYKTPRFKYGKKVQDEWRGEVKIVGLSAGL